MPFEIERKFLVRDNVTFQAVKTVHIAQGYIPTTNKVAVRLRIAGENAYITMKGPGSGISRPEFEYPVPLEDALYMMQNFCTGTMEKNRHYVEFEGHTWEVDEFLGDNAGLMLAEIELESAQEEFSFPPWIEKEVTDNPNYNNAYLAMHPFSGWLK